MPTYDIIKIGDNMKNRYLLLLIALVLLLVGCDKRHDDKIPIGNPNVEYTSSYDGSYGNAGKLQGTTIVVSIFVKDKTTSWTNSGMDKKSKTMILDKLSIATVYLTKAAASYGKTLKFAYDWEKYKDLVYEATFSEDLITSGGENYDIQKKWIENNINSKALKNKYKADNIIYMYYINTDFKNPHKPWTITHNTCTKCLIEFSNIFYRYEGIATPSGTIAHEMLHQFGAPDLYVKNYYIPQEYVDYMTKIDSKDIMYFINKGTDIESRFTELDAYYVGIGSKPKEVTEWNLGISEYERG